MCIRDSLDTNVSYVNATLTPTGHTDNVWYWEINDIPGMDGDGEFGYGEIVINTSVTLPLTNSTVLDFMAQLGDAEGDLLQHTAQTTVTSAPILSFYKSDGVSTVCAGDRLTYTLTYANSGNENAYDITITDTLPYHVEYVDCQIGDGDCQPVSPYEVIFHIPAIVAQTNDQARLIVRVNDPLPAGTTSLINSATMAGPSLPAPIERQDVDQIGTLPDLSITATHAPSLFSPGKLMTYTVTYSNTGHMDAEEVAITTALPPNTVYVGHGWNTSDGQTYIYAVVGDVLADKTNHLVNFTVEHNQPLISEPEFNTPFTITGGGPVSGDANPADNTTNVYVGVPDLVVDYWTVEPLPLQPNVPVTFTIVLMNQGTGMAWNPLSCIGDRCAGFFLDIYLTPVESYPYAGDGEFYASPKPIGPGSQDVVTITVPGGLSERQIRDTRALYVKVDNHLDAPYGLVPEYDETNNLGVPIDPRDYLYYIYLPLVQKNAD